MVTRSVSLIQGVNERLKISVGGYHRARAALTNLAPTLLETTWEETLRPLLDDDVRIMTAAQAEGVSEGRCTMSWIWRTTGVGDSSAGMQEGMSVIGPSHIVMLIGCLALRLEWCKARARAHRWHEECLLLEEEMRRVQESFMWEIEAWKRRANDAWSRADGNQDGQAAYALRQVDIRQSMLAHCRDVWVKAYELLHSVVNEPSLQVNY
ncbi:hypothetical protein L208DRAFT_1414202 [Tricholoma matsutake]|nr:hypothetical protein L208DRAFT_1414202 [Tricholoma matsutake 945]